MSVHKFSGITMIRTSHDGLDGKRVVTFKEDTSESNPFTITLSKTGMFMSGCMHKEIDGEHELQEFAQFMSLCWTERRKLMTKIHTTLTGH